MTTHPTLPTAPHFLEESTAEYKTCDQKLSPLHSSMLTHKTLVPPLCQNFSFSATCFFAHVTIYQDNFTL